LEWTRRIQVKTFKSYISRNMNRRRMWFGSARELQKNLFQRGLSLKMWTIQFFGIVRESPWVRKIWKDSLKNKISRNIHQTSICDGQFMALHPPLSGRMRFWKKEEFQNFGGFWRIPLGNKIRSQNFTLWKIISRGIIIRQL